jgi:nitrile hydratase subunit beta
MSFDPAPLYAPGDRVRIIDLGKPGHVRVPHYAREMVGVVERYGGTFQNPEDRAYGRGRGTAVRLYRIRLRQCDLWADYAGDPTDTLELEVYDHWLRPAGTEIDHG